MIKDEVLAALRERGGYVSGQELCDRFSVSRTAIWKAVSKLKEEGYEIDSVPNRGYCLLTSPDAMTEAEIRSYLHTEKMGKSLVCFADTDSTNIQAKLLAEQNAPDGTLVCSDPVSYTHLVRRRRKLSTVTPRWEALRISRTRLLRSAAIIL